jgi:hypothetical protein
MWVRGVAGNKKGEFEVGAQFLANYTQRVAAIGLNYY